MSLPAVLGAEVETTSVNKDGGEDDLSRKTKTRLQLLDVEPHVRQVITDFFPKVAHNSTPQMTALVKAVSTVVRQLGDEKDPVKIKLLVEKEFAFIYPKRAMLTLFTRWARRRNHFGADAITLAQVLSDQVGIKPHLLLHFMHEVSVYPSTRHSTNNLKVVFNKSTRKNAQVDPNCIWLHMNRLNACIKTLHLSVQEIANRCCSQIGWRDISNDHTYQLNEADDGEVRLFDCGNDAFASVGHPDNDFF